MINLKRFIQKWFFTCLGGLLVSFSFLMIGTIKETPSDLLLVLSLLLVSADCLWLGIWLENKIHKITRPDKTDVKIYTVSTPRNLPLNLRLPPKTIKDKTDINIKGLGRKEWT